MTEIMIIRDDRLKLFQVDDSTLARLTKIRGNLYKDETRLRTVADMPTMTQSQTPQISPEQMARAEASWAAHCMERQATPIQTVKPLGFEEQIQHAWKTLPGIRAEFASLASYTAYCRAVQDGRCRAYGKA